MTAREHRRLTQRLRHAKLRYPASIEDVDFSLLHELAVSRGDGSYRRLLAKLAKRDLQRTQSGNHAIRRAEIR